VAGTAGTAEDHKCLHRGQGGTQTDRARTRARMSDRGRAYPNEPGFSVLMNRPLLSVVVSSCRRSTVEERPQRTRADKGGRRRSARGGCARSAGNTLGVVARRSRATAIAADQRAARSTPRRKRRSSAAKTARRRQSAAAFSGLPTSPRPNGLTLEAARCRSAIPEILP
jgi:hypothetical protein